MRPERYSKQREVIYETVKGTNTHPTADWVYDMVREALPDISLGTVYRNLKYLCETGRMITVETRGLTQRFDADLTAHAHFVCDDCGGVSDMDTDDSPQKLTEKGYHIRLEKRVYYGLCPACVKKAVNRTQS